MFRALSPTSRISLNPRQIIAAMRSINSQPIALGNGPMRPSRAFIVTFVCGSGRYRIFVYLGATGSQGGSGPGLLFESDPPEIGFDYFEAFEHEAVDMVENQGFTMERVDFQAASTADKAAFIDALPFDGSVTPLPGTPAAAAAAKPPPPPPPPSTNPRGPVVAPAVHPRQAAVTGANPAIVGPTGGGSFSPVSEKSREIALPAAYTVEALGRLLSLF